jgi:ATP-dependent DNA ligase
MQLHVEGEKLRCFTRSGTDYTTLYKPFFDKIDIRSLIEAKSCILDGELVSWNPELECFGDFPLHTKIAVSMGGVRSRQDLTLEGLALRNSGSAV